MTGFGSRKPRPLGKGSPRRLGVLGTLVWDTIRYRDRRTAPVEEWGGIAYALEAMSASLPSEWALVPIIRIGRDFERRALRFLRTIPGVDSEMGIRVVPEANNRVELHYESGDRRCERLTGGVSPWPWSELASLAGSCDALYLNFISGQELAVDTALALRRLYGGPIYADLHSLFLGVDAVGERIPRELPAWKEWLACFDAVQMNEQEFELLGRRWGDPWKFAADLVGPPLNLIAVTLGSRGAAYVAAPEFSPDPMAWFRTRDRMTTSRPARSGLVPQEEGELEGDPTGSGDVWGATFFSRLLTGSGLEEAMDFANRMAARNVTYRGASGLNQHLRGRLSRGEEGA